jgi:hypothetical protein
MSSEPQQTPPLEMLTEWEGQAIHHPGVLFEEGQAEHLSGAEAVSAIAAWIAVTAVAGVVGNSAHEAIKQKVIGFLKGWRARFGQSKIDEVKKQLFVEMQKYRTNRKITDQELQERIELLFDEIDG